MERNTNGRMNTVFSVMKYCRSLRLYSVFLGQTWHFKLVKMNGLCMCATFRDEPRFERFDYLPIKRSGIAAKGKELEGSEQD
jgi:hypothetical protein